MGEAISRVTGGMLGGNSGTRGFGGGGGIDEKDFNPYLKAGAGAVGDLRTMLKEGFNPGDLTQDPGYQFQLEQGNRAIQQGAGMQGSPFSGNTMQALSQFNQGLAATTYNDAFNRWNQQVQNLAGLAGLGANAAGAKAGAQSSMYGSDAGVESARVGRGGSFFGAASNFFGL